MNCLSAFFILVFMGVFIFLDLSELEILTFLTSITHNFSVCHLFLTSCLQALVGCLRKAFPSNTVKLFYFLVIFSIQFLRLKLWSVKWTLMCRVKQGSSSRFPSSTPLTPSHWPHLTGARSSLSGYTDARAPNGTTGGVCQDPDFSLSPNQLCCSYSEGAFVKPQSCQTFLKNLPCASL